MRDRELVQRASVVGGWDDSPFFTSSTTYPRIRRHRVEKMLTILFANALTLCNRACSRMIAILYSV